MTAPGIYGVSVAFLSEFAISFALMITILLITNRERLARYTPYFPGALVAMFLTFEWPLSGMSMNPARSLGSAFHASYWYALWIYFTAPPLGMLAAAELFLAARGGVLPFAQSYTTRITSAVFSIADIEQRGVAAFNLL